MKFCKRLYQEITEFRQECTIPDERQPEYLIEQIKLLYQTKQSLKDKPLDDLLSKILIDIIILDNPAIAVKSIADLYNRDFWEIWDTIQEAYHNNVWKETPHEAELN